MKESDLCKNILQNLKTQNINITSEDLGNLYISALSCIFEKLDDGSVIDVDDLGSFWRKGEDKTSVTFFRPVDKLIDRINNKQ